MPGNLNEDAGTNFDGTAFSGPKSHGNVYHTPAIDFEPFEPNVFISITPDDIVTLTIPRPELGQGIRTALAMILAEELGADWERVRVVQAPAGLEYGNQGVGGSRSVEESFRPLRQLAAIARDMLIRTAAEFWEVEENSCCVEQGKVIHQPSGKERTYGDLAAIAAQLPAPNVVYIPLKQPGEFQIVGQRVKRVDEPQFITGRAIYGCDVRIPALRFATLARPPVLGAEVMAYNPEGAKGVEGVLDVVETRDGIAVIAENTWAAIKGREALEVEWDEPPDSGLSSEEIWQILNEEVEGALATIEDDLNVFTWVEARYACPYLAHTTMEPMNCTANVIEGGCQVWAPTQGPQEALRAAAEIASPPIRVDIPFAGGGFGRRGEVDYVREAVNLSKVIKAPVQVFWTREDDIHHDYFRPASVHGLRAGLDDRGFPISWNHFVAAQSQYGESAITAGATDLLYNIPSQRVEARPVNLPFLNGGWRAVFSNQNAFANECFMDEIAAVNGEDPFQFRMALLGEGARMGPVLELAASRAGWGDPLPAGWGRGIACHSTWGVTDVAQVVEVSVSEVGQVTVHRVVCAIDCGIVINPGIVEAQLEGGIAMGLSAAMQEEITFENGHPVQNNFNGYPILRMSEMPAIEVHIVRSDRDPGGVGEMGVPPIAPAIVNAIYAATGKRIRRLPIRAEELMTAR